ncbi:Serine proteinase inhibitor A3K [Thelohanellus kitauei]|uniref:Serine proteinase inhibitor A3K n=1 Tax=Thelohanellus kitauei TaxID=669202 RepID=A0A0C2MGQ6_THEKT|nr:Serine proteinase inhibitor A3K [Thelohanellus kitauei]
MSIEGVNRFTSIVLNHIFANQNATGNVALSGISLYVLLGAINIGLQRQSYNQLSRFLGEGFEELQDTGTWMDSHTAQKWTRLVDLASEFYMVTSALFCSCDINYHYKTVSDLLLRLHKINVNFSNPYPSDRNIYTLISMYAFGSKINEFEKSKLGEDGMIFMDAIFVSLNWQKKFNASHTETDIFYDNKGQTLEVEMMNQEGFNFIYDSYDHVFQVLFIRFKELFQFAAILLPREGHTIEDALTTFKFDDIYTYFTQSPIKYINLKMPKFKISSDKDYVQTFKDFGIADIFDRTHSDFGKMTNQTVFIGKLIQLLNVAVGELGVKADDNTDDFSEKSSSEPEKGGDTVVETRADAEGRAHSDAEDSYDPEDNQQLETDESEDSDEKSNSESEEERVFLAEKVPSDSEPFHVNRPFIFIIYSSTSNAALFSAFVTNPNTA